MYVLLLFCWCCFVLFVCLLFSFSFLIYATSTLRKWSKMPTNAAFKELCHCPCPARSELSDLTYEIRHFDSKAYYASCLSKLKKPNLEHVQFPGIQWKKKRFHQRIRNVHFMVKRCKVQSRTPAACQSPKAIFCQPPTDIHVSMQHSSEPTCLSVS